MSKNLKINIFLLNLFFDRQEVFADASENLENPPTSTANQTEDEEEIPNLRVTPTSRRARSAALQAKNFIEKRQAAELKFREDEHQLRMEEINLRIQNANQIFQLEEQRLKLDQERIAIQIATAKLNLKEAELKVEALEKSKFKDV